MQRRGEFQLGVKGDGKYTEEDDEMVRGKVRECYEEVMILAREESIRDDGKGEWRPSLKNIIYIPSYILVEKNLISQDFIFEIVSLI